MTVSCAGTRIAPSGQSDFHKEVQFRLSFPVAHDPTKDWSYAGIATTPGATPVSAPDIVLFDGSTQVWGALPSGGGGGTVTAPSAPGTPAAAECHRDGRHPDLGGLDSRQQPDRRL